MPRLEVVVGEMPQPPGGGNAQFAWVIWRRWNRTRTAQVGFVPPKPSHKRPCCKTCKGDACVGRCKF